MPSRRFFSSSQRSAQATARVHQFPTQSVDGVDPRAQLAQRSIRDEKFMTPEQVRDKLVLPSVNRVYDLIHLHGLPARRIGRMYRIEEAEFQAWTRGELDAQRR